MKIPESLKKQWDSLRSEGDPIEIAKNADLHPETVRLALRKGECSDKVFKVIAKFYEEKWNMISLFSKV